LNHYYITHTRLIAHENLKKKQKSLALLSGNFHLEWRIDSILRLKKKIEKQLLAQSFNIEKAKTRWTIEASRRGMSACRNGKGVSQKAFMDNWSITTDQQSTDEIKGFLLKRQTGLRSCSKPLKRKFGS